MWPALIGGIFLVVFGLCIVFSAKNLDSFSFYCLLLMGTITITSGILVISAVSYELLGIKHGRNSPLANSQSEHVESLELPNPVK